MNNQNSNFDLDHINDLFNDDRPKEAKQYLTQYFVPLHDGKIAMLIEGKYKIMDDASAKKSYFNRIPKDLVKYFFNEYRAIKQVKYKLNAPLFYDNYINLCPKMKHEYKAYNTFSDDVKRKVDIVLTYIKNIWCSNNEESYNFCVKWLSNMLKGKKNNSCLYLKCPFQGMGKSTIPSFIKKYVIGDELALETGSGPIKSNFNSILAGKLMVILEELENFGVSEWQTVSTVLKRLITSDVINIESKYVDSYEAENINNYILISNNDAIKDDDGRRYFVLDLYTGFLGEQEYFDNFYNNCYNDDVGHAFYCYMLEINTDNFNSQKYPLTQNKSDSIVKRLDSVYTFLKEKYILNKKHLLSSVGDLHEEYKIWCAENDHKAYGKIDFNKKMKDININYFKSGTNGRENRYKINHEDLYNIAKKFKWMHDLDVFKDKEPDVFDDNDYKTMFNELSQKYEDLKKQFDALKNTKYEKLGITEIKDNVLANKAIKSKSLLDAGLCEAVEKPEELNKTTKKKVIKKKVVKSELLDNEITDKFLLDL